MVESLEEREAKKGWKQKNNLMQWITAMCSEICGKQNPYSASHACLQQNLYTRSRLEVGWYKKSHRGSRILLKLSARKENLYLWNKSTHFEKYLWLSILFFLQTWFCNSSFPPWTCRTTHLKQMYSTLCILPFQNITPEKSKYGKVHWELLYSSAEYRSAGYGTLCYWNRRWYF